MRVALVHDWLTGLRGGERVLDELAALFPDADLYTLFHLPGSTTERIDALRVHPSVLDAVPGRARHYRKLLPLFPWAIERLRVADCDLVLSVSHAVAKGIRPPPGTPHLCYCLTPMRYVWDQADAYLGRGARRALATPLVRTLRRFDRRTSTPDRVTRFTAISAAVADRIERRYGRRARVVHPPVDTERFRPDGRAPDDFYLLLAAFVPYKREDVAIDACVRSGRRLVVVGDGPGRAVAERRAGRGVEFVGRVSDRELAGLLARCRALLHPQDEDFGLAPLEAQSAGRPVIAFSRGGARETVLPLDGPPHAAARATGVWLDAQTPDALVRALERFEAAEPHFDAKLIRTHAERFSAARFRVEIQREIQLALEGAADG
ncbi:MAG: glycosyltransferase [Myxococcota bacterium]|nr:glycosyltransferase [Myxococcota bacterium]